MPRKPPLFRVTAQGAPVLNSAYIVREAEGIVALEIDLKSKHCEVSAVSTCEGKESLWIEATEHSLHLHRHRKRDDITAIEFPRWPGYEIFATYLGRYTLDVCLVKRKE